MTSSRLFLALVVLWSAAPTAGADVSYRKLTRPADARTFYRRAGLGYRGRRVHIHVPASRLLARGRRVHTRRGGVVLVFENRSVALVVPPRSVYLRKVRQRVRRGQRICVKGVVLSDPRGGDRRAIWVHTLKRAP